MAAKKILFLVGDFVEDYEVMAPFHALLMVGHEGLIALQQRIKTAFDPNDILNPGKIFPQ